MTAVAPGAARTPVAERRLHVAYISAGLFVFDDQSGLGPMRRRTAPTTHSDEGHF
jgi:hypothetical protein